LITYRIDLSAIPMALAAPPARGEVKSMVVF